mmetsp:Transcript_9873/g.17290  ORF Transcript_9873/g.17290 Transcript_9873/m.17290 type:complete len:316 (-) Transcript_9873:59-1006(-)
MLLYRVFLHIDHSSSFVNILQRSRYCHPTLIHIHSKYICFLLIWRIMTFVFLETNLVLSLLALLLRHNGCKPIVIQRRLRFLRLRLPQLSWRWQFLLRFRRSSKECFGCIRQCHIIIIICRIAHSLHALLLRPCISFCIAIIIIVHIIVIISILATLYHTLHMTLLQNLRGLDCVTHHLPCQPHIPPPAILVHSPNQIGQLSFALIFQHDAKFFFHVGRKIVFQFFQFHFRIGRGSVEVGEDVGSEILGLGGRVGAAPGLFDGRAEGGPGTEGGGDSRLEVGVRVGCCGVGSGVGRGIHSIVVVGTNLSFISLVR